MYAATCFVSDELRDRHLYLFMFRNVQMLRVVAAVSIFDWANYNRPTLLLIEMSSS